MRYRSRECLTISSVVQSWLSVTITLRPQELKLLLQRVPLLPGRLRVVRHHQGSLTVPQGNLRAICQQFVPFLSFAGFLDGREVPRLRPRQLLDEGRRAR